MQTTVLITVRAQPSNDRPRPPLTHLYSSPLPLMPTNLVRKPYLVTHSPQHPTTGPSFSAPSSCPGSSFTKSRFDENKRLPRSCQGSHVERNRREDKSRASIDHPTSSTDSKRYIVPSAQPTIKRSVFTAQSQAPTVSTSLLALLSPLPKPVVGSPIELPCELKGEVALVSPAAPGPDRRRHRH